jgi:hypothetical protein
MSNLSSADALVERWAERGFNQTGWLKAEVTKPRMQRGTKTPAQGRSVLTSTQLQRQ